MLRDTTREIRPMLAYIDNNNALRNFVLRDMMIEDESGNKVRLG